MANVREVPLSRGLVALVDDEDLEPVSQYKWCALASRNDRFYAITRPLIAGKQRTWYLHRFILDLPPELEVHHLNGNGLDNRRENILGMSHRAHIQMHLASCEAHQMAFGCLVKSDHPRPWLDSWPNGALTTYGLANALGLSRMGVHHVARAAQAGTKVGGKWMFSADDVETIRAYRSHRHGKEIYAEVEKVRAERTRHQRWSRHGSSQFVGVCARKEDGDWIAYICTGGKQVHLGIFKRELDAALAYNAAALSLYGPFARLNVIPPEV